MMLYQPPPAEQVYQSHLPGRFAGYSLEHYFAERFPYQAEEEWVRLIEEGRITVNGETGCVGRVLRLHDHIVTRMGPRQEPPADCRLQLVYEDAHLRVFNKGAPLPVHPCGRYFQNSMTEILKRAFPGEVPRPVQRLDALTTGLQVFARTRRAASDLMTEFQTGKVEKEYLALVEGVPSERHVVLDQAIGKVLGSARGVGPAAKNPRTALTQVEWLDSYRGKSLLRVRPLTGRTNQIRVHLADWGFPLVGDPIYGTANNSEEVSMGLHAWRMKFLCLGRKIHLSAPVPGHFHPFSPDAVRRVK